MNITIYEDQTGLMLFPDKKTEKDIKIVSFFNNNVDLYIDKVGNNVTIYCHLMAFEASSRPLGYYVIYKNTYSDKIFSNFKREAYDVLHTLKIQPRIGHTDNVIFENIERFDDSAQYLHKDIDVISKVLAFNKHLSYNAGNIKDITVFCRQLLEMTTEIKISISTGKHDLGNVNILRNEKYQDPLIPTDETKMIFEEHRERVVRKLSEENKRITEEKKRIDGEVGDKKLREGILSIKEGLRIKIDAGYVNSEIENDIKRINNTIIDRPIFDMSRHEDTKQKTQTVVHTDKKIMIILSTIMLISGISTGILVFPYLSDNIKDKISMVTGKETVIPTPVPTVAKISQPIVYKTPEPIVNGPPEPTIAITSGPTVTTTSGQSPIGAKSVADMVNTTANKTNSTH